MAGRAEGQNGNIKSIFFPLLGCCFFLQFLVGTENIIIIFSYYISDYSNLPTIGSK